jgi:hypothetical protein
LIPTLFLRRYSVVKGLVQKKAVKKKPAKTVKQKRAAKVTKKKA